MSARHTQIVTLVMGAGDVRQVLAGGVNFEVVQTTTPIDVRLMTRDGAEVSGMSQAEAGYFINGRAFDAVQITSAAAQTVKVFIGDAEAGSRRVTGSIAIGSNVTAQVAPANTARTVTSASAQLLAASSTRRYLLIQNKDATGSIYLNFGAAAATVANGLRIGPGGWWEWDSSIPTTAIQAIGDLASNANILTIEG